jgi:hypothetical protein
MDVARGVQNSRSIKAAAGANKPVACDTISPNALAIGLDALPATWLGGDLDPEVLRSRLRPPALPTSSTNSSLPL